MLLAFSDIVYNYYYNREPKGILLLMIPISFFMCSIMCEQKPSLTLKASLWMRHTVVAGPYFGVEEFRV